MVLAYGGWDDVFTKTLIKVINDGSAYPDVLWTFHSGDQTRIEKDSASLLESLDPGVSRGRVALYRGIDCHSVLLKLRRRLMPSATGSVIALAETGNSATDDSSFVVEEVDLFDFAFRLVLDRQAPVDLLDTFSPRILLEATQRLSSEENNTRRFLDAARILAQRHPDATPNPLWVKWMKTTRADELKKLKSQIFS